MSVLVSVSNFTRVLSRYYELTSNVTRRSAYHNVQNIAADLGAPSRLREATDAAAEAIAARFGSAEVDGKIQAHVIAIST